MKDFIFIAGAPGSGKSTIAKKLQEKLGCPMFEFGWIPEFQNKGDDKITYTEEEEFSFENLVLVLKNYAKHGFKNVLVTDLNNKFIEKLPDIFKDYDYVIYTLRLDDKDELKKRVLSDNRSSGYRNWAEAIDINDYLLKRAPYLNEKFIEVNLRSPDQVLDEIFDDLKK